MAYILNIDTSSKNCSVALQNDEQLILSYDIGVEKSASSLINVYCGRAISDAGITFSQIEAVSVGIGPGSYTGLRIALSTAKGIALGIDAALIAVNTLEAMASSQIILAQKLDAYICPMIDARRMEVYTCVFDAQRNTYSKTEAMILNEDSFKDLLENKKVIFLGDGSYKLKDILQHGHALFVPDVLPSAKYMTSQAYHRFKTGQFEDVAYLEPYYLKQFVSTSKLLP